MERLRVECDAAEGRYLSEYRGNFACGFGLFDNVVRGQF